MAPKAAKTAVKRLRHEKKTGAAGGKKTGSGGATRPVIRPLPSEDRKKSYRPPHRAAGTSSGSDGLDAELEEEILRRQETVRDVCLVILCTVTLICPCSG